MNTKQKVLLGLAGLTALAVAGGSVGTMAWFYSNTTVTASGLSMSVKAPDEALSIYSGLWQVGGTYSTPSSSIDLGTTGQVLQPASAFWNGTFVNADQTGDYTMSYPCFFVQPKSINASGQAASGTTTAAWTTYNSSTMNKVINDSTNKYYVRNDFFVRLNQEPAVSLGDTICYADVTFTVVIKPSVTTFAPIHKALRWMIGVWNIGNKSSSNQTSVGIPLGADPYAVSYCTHSYLAKPASNATAFSDLTLSVMIRKNDATKVTTSTDFDMSLITWLEGSDSNCTTANASSFGTVSVSLEVKDPQCVYSYVAPIINPKDGD